MANSKTTAPASARITLLPALTAAGIALGVYLLTLAPDLTWRHFGGDGGELITAAATLGVPHPPGYPTYVLLGRLAHMLPIDPPALRFHLFSAVAAALAAGGVSATAAELVRPRTRAAASAPLAAGLSCAFAPLVWSQALIAEVYALNLAVVSLLLYAIVSRRPLWLRGTLFGLSLTTHLTSVLLLPLLLVNVPRQRLWRLLPGIGVGLLPYAAIPLLAQSESPVLWGNATTLGGWWWIVSGAIYRPNLFGVSSAELLRRLSHWAPVLLGQFTYLGLPLVALGVWRAEKQVRRFLLIGAGSALLYIIYAFGYAKEDGLVFTLPALLLLSIPLTYILRQSSYFGLLLPLALLTLHFSGQSVRPDDGLRGEVLYTLQRLPEQSVVLTPGDPAWPTLIYFHHVEGQRPDIVIVDRYLLAFDWYRRRLQKHGSTLQHLATYDVEGFVAANRRDRPVCFVAPDVTRFDCRSNTPPNFVDESDSPP